MHLGKEQQKNLTTSPCTMSIASIEESVKQGKKLIRHLPPEFDALFQKVLTPGTNVFSSWCEINMVDLENILSEVRSRLLDFALELRDVVGIDVPEKELAAKAANVDTERLFNTAVYGSGNTVIIGSHTFQAVTNEKDDLDGLLAAIGKLGFQQGILDQVEAQNTARTVNDFLAEQVRAHPTRYIGMATLALQDPDQAARELERCVTKLGFKGVMVNGYTQVESPDNLVYLDDERMTPSQDRVWQRQGALQTVDGA
jgi:hypothetical protein